METKDTVVSKPLKPTDLYNQYHKHRNIEVYVSNKTSEVFFSSLPKSRTIRAKIRRIRLWNIHQRLKLYSSFLFIIISQSVFRRGNISKHLICGRRVLSGSKFSWEKLKLSLYLMIIEFMIIWPWNSIFAEKFVI